MNLRDSILKNNAIMRMALAFYDFVRKNSDWDNRIQNVVANQIKGISDYDFEYDRRLYSFFYQYLDDNNVRCCIKEYTDFFDSANYYEYLLFDYSLFDKEIIKIHKCDTMFHNK